MQWYQVTAVQTFDVEGPRGGIKTKKVREQVLVEAELVSDAEMRALKRLYHGSPNEVEIVAVKESKIVDVLRDGE